MTECPCCSEPMIRQFRQKLVYWFCRRCWQAMPEGKFNLSLSSRSITLVTASGELPKEHFLPISIRSISLVTASEGLREEYSPLPCTSINLATELGIKKQNFSLPIDDYVPT
jgi:hypothetical protein